MLHRRAFLASSACAAASCACWPSTGWAEASEKPLRVCTELAMADLDLAFGIAIDENPANNPLLVNLPPSEAVSLYKKKWNPQRRILSVDFVDEPAFIDKIIKYARAWEEHMGLRFWFGKGAPDILISFQRGAGSWSYIGTDSKYYASHGQVSMNFGWFDGATEEDEFSRTTLHEFGHALSLVHEHSNPIDNQIDWNPPAVYSYYYDKMGWEKEDVDEQIFKKYELAQINATEYDKDSIMHYHVPSEFVTDQADVVGWNRVLSERDKFFIAQLYPPLSGG